MIGKLKGIIDTLGEDHILIDVAGVCYLVFASATCLRNLPPEGEAATLHIETHVREDHIHLFGFIDPVEKYWFNLLLNISGVGAKVAFSILSVLSADQLMAAIMAEDKAAFKPANGVGPKLATRIIAELQDKVGKIPSTISIAPTSATQSAKPAAANPEQAIVMDAVSALVNLGYNRSDAFQKATQIAAERNPTSVEELIRISLSEMAA